MKKALLVLFLISSILSAPLWRAAAQGGSSFPPAPIKNDEGGPVEITGQFAYSYAGFPDTGSQPIIFLGDDSLLFQRDKFNFHTEYLNTDSPQFIGQITSDIRTSPFTYRIELPINPGGVLTDIDNDSVKDPGVMVYTVINTFNELDDPFTTQREFINYSSMTWNPATFDVTGGTFVVYAPEDGAGFPSGFGPDGVLFSKDDPIVSIPKGYTIVYLNTDPFTFDRSSVGKVDIVESEPEFVDYSSLSYTKAFDAMVDMFRKKYAFTDYKKIDWDAKIAEFRPQFEAAEKNQDKVAYAWAVEKFLRSIPDSHVGSDAINLLQDQFSQETGGGLGMAIRQLDDGRIITNFILPGGPAEAAGIKLKAEIMKINGQPTADVVHANDPWSGPFSSDEVRLLQQLRYAVRFPADTKVEVTFQNPGDSAPTTATLTAVAERDSFRFSSFSKGLTGYELPVEFKILDNGYGYVKVYSFDDDNLLTLILWQRAIRLFNNQGVTGIILDMRQNGGGSSATGAAMASTFFDKQTVVASEAYYNAKTDKFELNHAHDTVVYPAPEIDRYTGNVAVMVGPGCASECEFFSYFLTESANHVDVVGQYASMGAGGSIQYFGLPEGINAQYTEGRAVTAAGDILLEGKGVVPTVRVPVNEDTLFAEGDPVLDAAVAALDKVQPK